MAKNKVACFFLGHGVVLIAAYNRRESIFWITQKPHKFCGYKRGKRIMNQSRYRPTSLLTGDVKIM